MTNFFILVPLILYLPMFIYETYIAFRRIGKPKDAGGEYLHATWEITHTFLILTINYFIWFYSSAVVDVANAVFLPLLIFGVAFILRSALYVYLFYIKITKKPAIFADQAFAWLHIVILGCLSYTVLAALNVMFDGNYQANDAFMPLLLPGLIFTVPLIVLPIMSLYRNNNR